MTVPEKLAVPVYAQVQQMFAQRFAESNAPQSEKAVLEDRVSSQEQELSALRAASASQESSLSALASEKASLLEQVSELSSSKAAVQTGWNI